MLGGLSLLGILKLKDNIIIVSYTWRHLAGKCACARSAESLCYFHLRQVGIGVPGVSSSVLYGEYAQRQRPSDPRL